MIAFLLFFRRKSQLHTCPCPDAICTFLRHPLPPPIFSFFYLQVILLSFYSEFHCSLGIRHYHHNFCFPSLLMLFPFPYLPATLLFLFPPPLFSFSSKANISLNFIFLSLASLINLNYASVIQKITSTTCLPFSKCSLKRSVPVEKEIAVFNWNYPQLFLHNHSSMK